jgi:hypothetical protein
LQLGNCFLKIKPGLWWENDDSFPRTATYITMLFGRKILVFFADRATFRCSVQELKSPQLEKRLETGSVVAARASTGLWINITKIMHLVHGC